jgi:hypothetical protein
MKILIGNEEREYDDDFSKNFHSLIRFIKLSWEFVFIIWIILSILYLLNLHNTIIILFLVPVIYTFLTHVFIIIYGASYYNNFWNLNIWDSKYLKEYYLETFNRL